jgi:putative FmdB family regulatory protein
MPLYEYECEACGRFELLQRFSDPALTACPRCGSRVEKLLSAPAIQFKGTGWYVTDYARKSSENGKEKKSKESADAAAKSSKGETSTPSKTTSKDSSASGSSPTK